MCGIVGLVDYGGHCSADTLRELTHRMRDTLRHRGPDDAGLWLSPDGRVCLGQRRLAIIDLSADGRQPMLNEDGRVAITFNGEIYNFQELRQRLQAAGHRFRSRTDTEVLCHLLEGDPEVAIRQLRGMFAFAAWRHPSRELVLARDPFGKKPLYYLQKDGFLAFASELRALQLLPDMLGDIDPAAIQEYLLLQYVHAPRTIYRDVRKLEPGTFLQVQFGRHSVRRKCKGTLFSFAARQPAALSSARWRRKSSLCEELRSQLIDAVRDRLVADVPLGAFLSGGNDSSLVVAVMARELGVKVKTFSVGFANSPSSEHHAARHIAEHLGTEHYELIVEPSAVEQLPTIVAALDEPNGDSSCLPVYLLCQFARQRVTVALSGDGGDEMFGGYGRYGDTIRESTAWAAWRRWLKQRQRWSAGQAYLSERILPMTEPTLKHLAGELQPEVADLLERLRAIADAAGPVLHRLRTLDAMSYMPGAVLAKVDRMSMQFALEVRCPLLDKRLAEWAQTLPASCLHDGKTPKILLKWLALRYLPESIVYRPKQGFGVPDQCWSQSRLLDLAESLLTGPGARLTAYLDAGRLRAHLQQQRSPTHFHVYQVWELLVLEQWLRMAAMPAARQAA